MLPSKHSEIPEIVLGYQNLDVIYKCLKYMYFPPHNSQKEFVYTKSVLYL